VVAGTQRQLENQLLRGLLLATSLQRREPKSTKLGRKRAVILVAPKGLGRSQATSYLTTNRHRHSIREVARNAFTRTACSAVGNRALKSRVRSKKKTMKTVTARLAPPNSLILILDPQGAEIPATTKGELISSTETCIAVGCMSEDDGETELTLGEAKAVDPGYAPTLEKRISTPTRKLTVQSVHGVTLLETHVPSQSAAVQVWVNDAHEPDKVVIGVMP